MNIKSYSSAAITAAAVLMIALALGGVTWVIAEGLVSFGLNSTAPTEPVPETTNILPSEDDARFLLWLLLLPMTVFMLVFSGGVALSGPGRSRRRAQSKPAAPSQAEVRDQALAAAAELRARDARHKDAAEGLARAVSEHNRLRTRKTAHALETATRRFKAYPPVPAGAIEKYEQTAARIAEAERAVDVALTEAEAAKALRKAERVKARAEKRAARATAKVPPVVPNPPMPVIDLGPDAPPSKGDVTDTRGQ